MTRRELLDAIGRAGGGGSAFTALCALGLAGVAADPGAGPGSTSGATFRLQGQPGRDRTVLILGGGLTGLCAAYELGRAGYDCRILEARERPGGRCHTLRGGTTEQEVGGGTQTCGFDAGLYFNPGPARIPQHHVTLDYCRELGVAIEPFCQVNEAAYLYLTGGKPEPPARGPLRVREVRSDLLGYTSELLTKALNKQALDGEVNAEDRDRLRGYLALTGELGGESYRGGLNRGALRSSEGEFPSGRSSGPIPFSELLAAAPAQYFMEERGIERQPMLFQIAGGTDNLARAFAKRLGSRVTYGAPVRGIQQTEKRVRVIYGDEDGRERTADADFCVCTLPVPLLRKLTRDSFGPPVRAALAAAPLYADAGKIGLQFKRRFWEEDDRIFGGITRTDLPLGQIWYPSTGFLGKKGVVVGYYVFDAVAAELAALAPEDRARRALDFGSRVHGPAYRAEFECGISMAWGANPYSLGAWGQEDVPALHQPDGRLYFASADRTPLNGWMAGAFEAARVVARAVHERAQKDTAGQPKGATG